MKLDKRHEGCDDYYLFSAAEEGSLTCINVDVLLLTKSWFKSL